VRSFGPQKIELAPRGSRAPELPRSWRVSFVEAEMPRLEALEEPLQRSRRAGGSLPITSDKRPRRRRLRILRYGPKSTTHGDSIYRAVTAANASLSDASVGDSNLDANLP